jgi:hypothetical protein
MVLAGALPGSIRTLLATASGFITAFYSGMLALGRFQMAIYGIDAQHRPPESWIPMFSLASDAGILTIFVLAYAVIRYSALADHEQSECYSRSAPSIW